MELVEVRRNEIYCDTGIIARKFGMKHADVARAMETLIPKLDDFRVAACDPKNLGFNPTFLKEARSYRGTNYIAYLLNRDCYMLLAMRFDTKLARKWQGQFIAAFNIMENQLIAKAQNENDPAFISQRAKGKIARIEETDVIKEFVDYATGQGSQSAKFYYKHITNATYRALGLMVQSRQKLRDVMNFYEISELLLAERLAKNSLKKYMALGRYYKDIYDSVKDDLIQFGSALRIGCDDMKS